MWQFLAVILILAGTFLNLLACDVSTQVVASTAHDFIFQCSSRILVLQPTIHRTWASIVCGQCLIHIPVVLVQHG